MSNKIVDVEALKEFRKRNDARYQRQYPKEFVKVSRQGNPDLGIPDKYLITFDAPVTLLAGSFVGKKSKNKYYKASELSRNKKGNCILFDNNTNLLQLPAGTYSYAQILKFVLDKLWFLKIVEERELIYDMDVVEQKISNQDIDFQDIETYFGGTSNKLFKTMSSDTTTTIEKTFYRSSNSEDDIQIPVESFDSEFSQRYNDSTAAISYGISLRLRFVKNFELKEGNEPRANGWTGQMSNYQMKIMVNFYRDTDGEGDEWVTLTDFYAAVQITN